MMQVTQIFSEVESPTLNANFTLKDCLELLIKCKNADPDKYSYSGYDIVFDSCSLFSILSFDWVKNVIIFGVDEFICAYFCKTCLSKKLLSRLANEYIFFVNKF